MNVMNKKSSPIKNTDTSIVQGNLIEQVTQIYFQKNQSYIWKRLRHQWAEKVIKYCSSKKINSRDQIEDFIYKYLKQLMGWIEKSNNLAVGQKKLIEKNEEIIVLKNKIKQHIKIQKQKEDKIMRRDLRIKKFQKTIQDFYQKLSIGQVINRKEKIKLLQAKKNLEEQRNSSRRYQKCFETMRKAVLDIIKSQKQKNNKLIKQISQQLTNQIKRLERQGDNYKQICNSLVMNLEQKNRNHIKIKKQLNEVKNKHKDTLIINEKLRSRKLQLQKYIYTQKQKMEEQIRELIKKIKELQQNYSLLQQQYIKKEQQSQFHKDQCLILSQKYKVSMIQNQLHSNFKQYSNLNTSSSITYQQYQVPPIQRINKNTNVQLLCQYIDACVGDQDVTLNVRSPFRLQNHVIHYTYCNSDRNSKLFDSAIQTQQVQLINFKQKTQGVKSDNQSCSSSQSEYIYQYDIGTQCPHVQTQCLSTQTHILNLKDQIIQTHIISQFQDKYSQTQFLFQGFLSKIKALQANQQTYIISNQYLEQKIDKLKEELEISKKSQQITQKQLKQLKILYDGTRVQLIDVKHRLIEYLQKQNIEEDTKHIIQQMIKITNQQQKLNELKKENDQLKKYNQQLLQTIEYANSLFSGTGINQSNKFSIDSKNYMKSLSKHQNFAVNNYNINYTQSTGSHNRQYSQRSLQQPINISNYVYQNDQQKQSQSEYSMKSHQQSIRGQQRKIKGQFKQYREGQQRISRQLQSYGAAVSRLLSQFINIQNKQEMKMNAFLTLVQMLKPKGQLEQKFKKFIKLKKLMNSLGVNETQNTKLLKEGQEDIKSKLYRFLTSN